jgi:ribosomal protein L9
MKKSIEVPESFIRLIRDTREAQKAYFEAALTARKTNLPQAWAAKKEKLLESKNLEAHLDQQTAHYLGEIYGSISAQKAIEQLRLDLDADLQHARKEASSGT